jgi:hypothetical protein
LLKVAALVALLGVHVIYPSGAMRFTSSLGLTLLALSGSNVAVQATSSKGHNHPSPSVPQELWSPLIPQKLARTSANVSTTVSFQLTDSANGTWVPYGVNYWTAGFLPVQLYAMHRREELCPSLKTTDTDWLERGREWSLGLLPLVQNNTVQHDVGFLSFPFFEELKMCVYLFISSPLVLRFFFLIRTSRCSNPNNETAKNAILGFGQDLANRYDPIVGCTRSWDRPGDPSNFWVIIDNMVKSRCCYRICHIF